MFSGAFPCPQAATKKDNTHLNKLQVSLKVDAPDVPGAQQLLYVQWNGNWHKLKPIRYLNWFIILKVVYIFTGISQQKDLRTSQHSLTLQTSVLQ